MNNRKSLHYSFSDGIFASTMISLTLNYRFA